MLSVSLLICCVAAAATGKAIYRFYFHPYGSVLRSIIYPATIRLLTSEAARRLLWRLGRFTHRGISSIIGSGSSNSFSSNSATIFITIEDPHSFILLQCIKMLKQFYNVGFDIKILKPGVYAYDESNRDKQQSWLLKDSKVFAYIYNCKNIANENRYSKFRFNPPTVTSTFLRDSFSLDTITNDILLLGSKLGGTDSDEFLDVTLEIFISLWVSGKYQFKVDEFLKTRLKCDSINSGAKSESDMVDFDLYLQNNKSLLNKIGYFGPGVISFYGKKS